MYTTMDEIYARLRPRGIPVLTSSTHVTLDDAERMIVSIEGEVNGVMRSAGFTTVPATDPSDIATISRHVADKVASMIYDDMVVGDVNPDSVKTWKEDYRDFISRLKSGSQALPSQLPTQDDVVGIVGSIYDRNPIFGSLAPPQTSGSQ